MMNLCTIGARHPLRAAAVIVISGGLLCACSGADGAKAVADALSTLETAHYTVGGTVSALSGTGLVVEDNGGDDRAIASNGSFTFATSLAAGASYSVTVKTQPTDPPQACTVSNGSGTVGSSNITNVVVDCSLTAVATAVGTPVGQPSSQTIDAAGGSIVSPDNRLTVTVPPNAVATATTLTIQPITNQAPGGLGSAYRLGPEGQTFDTPVQISFHYTSQDLAGTVTDALEIAYQNTQDYWQAYKSATLDTAQQTLTVTSSHFSDWSMLAGSQIQPPAASVQVGNTVALTLVFCEKVATLDGTPDGLLTSLMAKCASGIDLASDWEVNSIAGGNASVGTVVADSGSEDSATYTAPAAVPQANPVAVSTQSAVFVPGQKCTCPISRCCRTVARKGRAAAGAERCKPSSRPIRCPGKSLGS